MSNPFFDHPILNSPYEIPRRHWELDPQGQPTQRILETRRRAEFITPIPKPRKRKPAPNSFHRQARCRPAPTPARNHLICVPSRPQPPTQTSAAAPELRWSIAPTTLPEEFRSPARTTPHATSERGATARPTPSFLARQVRARATLMPRLACMIGAASLSVTDAADRQGEAIPPARRARAHPRSPWAGKVQAPLAMGSQRRS